MTSIYDLFTKQPTAPPADAQPDAPTDRGDTYALTAIEAELERLRALPYPWRKDSRWDATTFEVACRLIEIGNAPWNRYSTNELLDRVRANAPRDHAWGEVEHEAKIRSALKRVGASPATLPDKSPLEPIPDVTPLRLPEPHGVDHDADGEADEDDDRRAALAAWVTENLPAIDWQALWDDDSEDEWILEPLLPARRLVALYSPPKVGKSLLSLEVAAAVSCGREVLGAQPERRWRVLYVDFENDPRADVRTRLQAMGYKPADLDQLHYLSFPTLDALDSPAGANQLLAAVEYYGAELVVIDTLSRAVAGEENDNDTWLAFYRNTGLRLKQAEVACLRLDHAGKDVERGQRGGSAKAGDVDLIWRMTGMTETTFALTCEANRLPVASKRVAFERRALPHLHSFVDKAAQLPALHRKVDELIDLMDAAGLPEDAGRTKLDGLLRGTGITASTDTKKLAVKRRKERPKSTVLSVRSEGGQVPVRDNNGQARTGGTE